MPNGIGSRLKTGSSQTGQLPGRIKSGLRVIEWSHPPRRTTSWRSQRASSCMFGLSEPDTPGANE